MEHKVMFRNEERSSKIETCIRVVLGRPRCRWEDNIKMNLQEVGCGGKDWIDLAEDRNRRRAIVNAVMNPRVPEITGNSLTS
jgi:hypothetical protein